MADAMTALVIVVLVIGAYFLGRLMQWVADAKSVMGSRLHRRS
jgi:hypothetical protein